MIADFVADPTRKSLAFDPGLSNLDRKLVRG
jgi:hypothetical protein